MTVVIGIGGQHQYLTACRQHGAHQTSRCASTLCIVHTDKTHSAAARRITVDRNDRNAQIDDTIERGIDFRGIAGRDRQTLDPFLDQCLNRVQFLLFAQRFQLADDHIQPTRAQLGCRLLCALGHGLHGRCLHRLNQKSNFYADFCACKRPSGLIGFISEFGRDLPDTCLDLLVDVAAIVHHAVDRTARDPGQLGNLPQGNCHLFSPSQISLL